MDIMSLGNPIKLSFAGYLCFESLLSPRTADGLSIASNAFRRRRPTLMPAPLSIEMCYDHYSNDGSVK